MQITAFDFDGTLTTKDSLKLFLIFAFGSFRYWIGIGILSPWLIGYKLGFVEGGRAKEQLFRYFFRKMKISRFERLCSEFQLILGRYIRPDMLERLQKARKAGDTLCIISASPENWIRPWAEKEGVDYVIATRLEADSEGRLTGFFATPNCSGKEKVNRLLAAFPELQNNRKNYTLYAYGDSAGDKPLIDFADRGWYILKSGNRCPMEKENN